MPHECDDCRTLSELVTKLIGEIEKQTPPLHITKRWVDDAKVMATRILKG